MIGAEVEHEGTGSGGRGSPPPIGSAVVGLAGGLLRPGYRHSAAHDRSRRRLLLRRSGVSAGLAQTVAAQQEDFGVLDQSVGDGGGDGRIKKDVAPVGKGRVGGDDGRALLTVAG